MKPAKLHLQYDIIRDTPTLMFDVDPRSSLYEALDSFTKGLLTLEGFYVDKRFVKVLPVFVAEWKRQLQQLDEANKTIKQQEEQIKKLKDINTKMINIVKSNVLRIADDMLKEQNRE